MEPYHHFDVYTAVAPRDRNARGPATSFPLKLHQMLDQAEQCGYQDIVSWLPGGKAFKIHNPEGMVSILKTHFNQTKYKSFLRQIQNYGFHRFTRGPRKGVCTHKLFVQWDPLLCLQMKRSNKVITGQLSPSMSSMVFQGHCLKTTSVGSLSKEECDRVMLHSADTKNDSFEAKDMNSSKILNPFKKLPYAQDKPEDDSWLTKLLTNQDLWMASNMDHHDVNFDSLFEPNHVIFPETSEILYQAIDINPPL
jgi:hypothetical protein